MSFNSFSQVYEKVCPSRELSEEQLNYCLNQGTTGEQGNGQETVEDLSTQLQPFFQIGCWEEQATEDLFDFGDMETSSQSSLMDRCKCQHDTGVSFCKSRDDFYRDLEIIKDPIKVKATEGIIALAKNIITDDHLYNPSINDNDRKFCGFSNMGEYLTRVGCSASSIEEINNTLKEKHFDKCHIERSQNSSSSFSPLEQKAFCGPPASLNGFDKRLVDEIKGNANYKLKRKVKVSEIERDILGINQATANILNENNINDELQLNTDLVENFTFSFRTNEEFDNFIANSLGLSQQEKENHLSNLKQNFFLISDKAEQFPGLSSDKIELFRKIQIRVKATPDYNHLFLLTNDSSKLEDYKSHSARNLMTLQRVAYRLGLEASSDQVNSEMNRVKAARKCEQLAQITQTMCNPDYNFFNFFPQAENGLEKDQLATFLRINMGAEGTSNMLEAADHLSCAVVANARRANDKMTMEAFSNNTAPDLNIPNDPIEDHLTAEDVQITQAKRVARQLDHLEQALKRDSSPEAQERVFKQLKEMEWPEFMGANPFTGSMTVDDAIFKARNSVRDWIVSEADSIEADFQSGQKQKRADALNRLNAFKNGGMESLAEELDSAIERTNPSRRGYVKRATPRQEENYVSRGGKTKADEVRWQPSWSTNAPAPVAGTGAAPTGEPTYENSSDADPFKMVPRPEEKNPKGTIPKADSTASTKGGSSSSGRGIASTGGSLGSNAVGTGPSGIDEGPIVLSMEEAVGEEFDNKLKTEDKLFVYDYKEDIVLIYEKDDKGKQAELVRKIPREKIEKAPEEFPDKLFRIFKRYRVKRLNHLLSLKRPATTLDQTS